MASVGPGVRVVGRRGPEGTPNTVLRRRGEGLRPLSVPVAGHSRIFGMAAVGHPPPGEAAVEEAFLGALAGHVVHPDPAAACGDIGTHHTQSQEPPSA